MVVVSVRVVVPHVGGEVAVDVGVGEICGEAQAEDEASQDAQPAPSVGTHVRGEGLLHFSDLYFTCSLALSRYATMRFNRRVPYNKTCCL